MIPFRASVLALVLVLATSLAPLPRRVDLDVAVPPGSPLDWGRAFPAITPPRKSLYPESGEREPERDPTTTSSKSKSAEVDVRYSSSFGLVRILTWDLTGHLPWIGPQEALGPITGRRPFERDAPRFGDALYWVTLAPLLRLMLHPEVVSRAETIAHLTEIGAPSLAVLNSASIEKSLTIPAETLRRLIVAPESKLPKPLAGSTPRDAMLARFVFEELERDHPYDPEGTFGKRFYLFHEEVEPILRRYADSPAIGVQRRAVAALARYDTFSAESKLFDAAFLTDDPVTVIRALSALGRVRSNRSWKPLVERLDEAEEPALRVALIGTLGRAGAREALPTLLRLGKDALNGFDTETLMAILSALTRISPSGHRDEIEAFVAEVEHGTNKRPDKFRPPGERSNHRADRADPPGARAEVLEQLALLVRRHLTPGDEQLARRIVGLPNINPALIQVSGGRRGRGGELGRVHPPVQLLWLDALGHIGESGQALLRVIVDSTLLEAPVRGHALGRLPWEVRRELADGFARDPEMSPEMRLQALEVMLYDRDPRVEAICRGLLAECAAQPADAGTPAQRFLFLRVLRELSERGRLATKDLLPLLFHVKAPRHAFDDLPAEVREEVAALVAAAAQDAQKTELRRRIDAILDILVKNQMNPRVNAETRKGARSFVEEQLASVRAHRSDPGYVRSVTETILLGLLGWGSPVEDSNLAEFSPEILLEQEIVLALGRTREPQAAEVLIQVLGNRRNTNRAAACLALGMTGQEAFAKQLTPFLLDEDPFTRLCAYESLRRLTDKDVAIDWMYAPSEERFAAAEDYLEWFLEQGR